jgi:hypothetical protein
VNSVCVPLSDTGGECDDTADCLLSHVCDVDTCRLDDGQTCMANTDCVNECVVDTCGPPAGTGGACAEAADCAANHSCDVDTCRLDDGQSCVDNTDCVNVCISALCGPPSGHGGACDEADDCVTGTSCGGDNICRFDDWWDPAWSFREQLTFDNTGRTQLDNFPVMVRITGARINYGSTEPNGEDLRFVDADNTPLAYEIEEWVSGGTSYAWVKVPRIDAGSSVDFIWMYYGNSGVSDGQNAAGVWTEGYEGVWHLNESGDASGYDYINAVGTGHDGRGGGGSAALVPVRTAGQIGYAQRIDGADDIIEVPDDAALEPAGDMTLSAWLRLEVPPSITGETAQFVYKRELAAAPWFSYHFSIDTADVLTWIWTNDAQVYSVTYTTFSLVPDTWYDIVGVREGNEVRVYVDGTDANSALGADPPSGSLFNSDGPLCFGSSWDGEVLNGDVDEVRVSRVPRTADWIDAQHASMTDMLILP